MANLINESEIRATWSPIIESATGINDSSKLAWMSEYCHNHKLYEEANLSAVTPIMLKGMGATSFPSDFGASPTTAGSGDKAPTLLPLAMQVAAQTIALDLVPVVPMAGPMGLLSYLDFVYDGGAAANVANAKNVYVLKTDDPTAADIAAGTNACELAYEFIGTSRIDGLDIYQTTGVLTAPSTLLLDFRLATANAAATVELVQALEDHLPSFSGVASGANIGDPLSREVGEKTPENIMGLSLFSKSVSAETFQVAAAVTREQVQDLKQFGVDAVAQVEAVLTNELTQSINKYILKEMNRLGDSNVTKSGVALNLTLTVGAGGNTRGDEHRRILTNSLAAANLIANRGRRGAGNFAVVDAKIASALQGVAGFVPNPMANTFSQMAGAIYPVGSLAGINVYTDPLMPFQGTLEATFGGGAAIETHKVLVGRKGDGNSAGLVFMPYLMAESVQTIAEGTMAPKVAVKSRFALVEAGFHAETQYFTFKIQGLEL
tara:strand:+ start:24333 stop:25805 length:1473 start_codon:yes stop_codon:yes gene_type:complete